MVRMTGLEPAHLSVLEPKSNVSANFTTPAYSILVVDFDCRQGQLYNSNVVAQPKSCVSANFTTPAYSILTVDLVCRQEQYHKTNDVA